MHEPMTGDEWHLLCSGPSAQGVRIPRGCRVACVNGSTSLTTRRPSAYLVSEIPAAGAYKRRIAELLQQDTRVYMRPAAHAELKRLCPRLDTSNVRLIDNWWGPELLQPLHRARPLPRVLYGPRPNAPWLSSGVLMLWILLELHRPTRITVHGMDGYVVDPGLDPQADVKVQGAGRIDGEYAGAVKPLPSRPARCELWVNSMNELMAAGIGQLSNYYLGTEIVFPRKPRHYSADWRVTLESQ